MWQLTWSVILLAASPAAAVQANEVVINPYEAVDWDNHEHHKAALHLHTLQSDGYQLVDEVVRVYADLGFTIISITDHDTHTPNTQVERGRVDEDKASPYPDPEPENFPHQPTWPWPDYGAPSPEELSVLGIKGNELSSQHHMNSFFNDYGIGRDGTTEDEQIEQVGSRRGVMFLDHPGISANWWTRRPVSWYAELFERHPSDVLVGVEVTNSPPSREQYDERLWDQLLARFMPERPVWGFGTDDMHNLASTRESDSIFMLDELSKDAVRQAMVEGQFYFRKSTRRMDVRDGRGPFPTLERFEVDEAAGTIELEASGYDGVKWITAPESLDEIEDHETSHEPWPAGRLIKENELTINYRDSDEIDRYLRVELYYEHDDETFRVFTNPVGFEVTD